MERRMTGLGRRSDKIISNRIRRQNGKEVQWTWSGVQ